MQSAPLGAHHSHRTVTTLSGLWKMTLVVRQCLEPSCPRFHHPYRPEEEGGWALPHGEFGLAVIALIGTWRFREHRSVPEMHQALLARGMSIAQRSVTYLMQRYEELVALRITDQERIKTRLQKQGHVILALDGLQPDVGHEVLWVVRDCLCEEILLARPLLSSTSKGATSTLSVSLLERCLQAALRGRPACQNAVEEAAARRATDRACLGRVQDTRKRSDSGLLFSGSSVLDRRWAFSSAGFRSQIVRSRHPGERLPCSWEDKKKIATCFKAVAATLEQRDEGHRLAVAAEARALTSKYIRRHTS